MRILFAGRYDWANVSHRVARGMAAAAGAQVARVLVLSAHPFGYVEDRFTKPELLEWARTTDWVISTGDGDYEALTQILARLPFRADVALATCHVGSAYRQHPGEFNRVDAEVGFRRRFVGGDLYRLTEDDPLAVPYFAPPGAVAVQLPEHPGPIRVAHSPSSREKKGTSQIIAGLGHLAAIGAELDIIEGVSYSACNLRRSRAHLFVDQLNPEVGGFGASSVEAMGAGCAVLADTHNIVPAVDRFYPRPPIVDVQTPAELAVMAESLITQPERLAVLRAASLRWAQDVATPMAVGRYWLKHLTGEAPCA